ncbi:MAG TPA: transglycosylase SLT domain-containing protein [Gemmatimonadaceae bacterium]|nr:transglycosylase SLT domain-containing protein [Gemmatimonadaceae bacterium]
MKHPRHSYTHRGDHIRRWNRIKKGLLIAAFLGAAALLPHERPAEAIASASPFSKHPNTTVALRQQLDAARGEISLLRSQLDRANMVMKYSTRYHIAADLSGSIYDIALAEGIDPELGFRVINVESQFYEHATSPVGAIGLTQLMPATARYFRPGISRAALYDRTTNLRIGFRYLHSLITDYQGNVKLALLAYNRGPATVASLQARGIDPGNGYGRLVTKGYTGAGVIN